MFCANLAARECVCMRWPGGRRINLLGLRKHLVPSLNTIAPLLPSLALSDPELSLEFTLLLATVNAEVCCAHFALT